MNLAVLLKPGWKLLPEQGPPSRCSTSGCQERAVAVYEGRRRRWFCETHLEEAR